MKTHPGSESEMRICGALFISANVAIMRHFELDVKINRRGVETCVWRTKHQRETPEASLAQAMFRYTDIVLTFRGHLRQPRAKATAKQDGNRSQPAPLFPTSFESYAQNVVKYGSREYGDG